MAQYVLQDSEIWLGGAIAQTYSNQMSFEISTDTPDTTTFGNKWRYHIEEALKTSTFTVSGFRIADDTKFHMKRAYEVVDDTLWDKPAPRAVDSSKYGEADVKWCFLFPEGATTGKICYGTRFQGVSYQEGMQLGEGLTWSMSGTGTGQVMRGMFIANFDGIPTSQTEDYRPIPEAVLGSATAERTYMTAYLVTQLAEQEALNAGSTMAGKEVIVRQSDNIGGTRTATDHHTHTVSAAHHMTVTRITALAKGKYYGLVIDDTAIKLKAAVVVTNERPTLYKAP